MTGLSSFDQATTTWPDFAGHEMKLDDPITSAATQETQRDWIVLASTGPHLSPYDRGQDHRRGQEGDAERQKRNLT